MKSLSILTAIALASSFSCVSADVKPAPAAETEDAKKESNIVGTWTGKPEKADEEMTLTFTADGKFTIEKEGEEKPVGGTYKLDESKTPCHLTLTMKRDGEEHTGYTIIEFEGPDKAKIAEPSEEAEKRPEAADKGDSLKLTRKKAGTAKDKPAVDAKEAAKQLIGTWGEKDDLSITFNEDGSLTGKEGGEPIKGTYKLNASKSPMHLDIQLVDHEEKSPLLSLIKFKDADTLLMTEPEEERATTMDDVTTLKRKK